MRVIATIDVEADKLGTYACISLSIKTVDVSLINVCKIVTEPDCSEINGMIEAIKTNGEARLASLVKTKSGFGIISNYTGQSYAVIKRGDSIFTVEFFENIKSYVIRGEGGIVYSN
jgi:hypothetical protein